MCRINECDEEYYKIVRCMGDDRADERLGFETYQAHYQAEDKCPDQIRVKKSKK